MRFVLSAACAGAVALMLPATVLAAEVRSGGDKPLARQPWTLLTSIPVVGALVALAATVLGIGALVLSGWQAYHASTPTQVAPVLEPKRTPLQAAA